MSRCLLCLFVLTHLSHCGNNSGICYVTANAAAARQVSESRQFKPGGSREVWLTLTMRVACCAMASSSPWWWCDSLPSAQATLACRATISHGADAVATLALQGPA